MFSPDYLSPVSLLKKLSPIKCLFEMPLLLLGFWRGENASEFPRWMHPRGVSGHAVHTGLFILDLLFIFCRSRAVCEFCAPSERQQQPSGQHINTWRHTDLAHHGHLPIHPHPEQLARFPRVSHLPSSSHHHEVCHCFDTSTRKDIIYDFPGIFFSFWFCLWK